MQHGQRRQQHHFNFATRHVREHYEYDQQFPTIGYTFGPDALEIEPADRLMPFPQRQQTTTPSPEQNTGHQLGALKLFCKNYGEKYLFNEQSLGRRSAVGQPTCWRIPDTLSFRKGAIDIRFRFGALALSAGGDARAGAG